MAPNSENSVTLEINDRPATGENILDHMREVLVEFADELRRFHLLRHGCECT